MMYDLFGDEALAQENIGRASQLVGSGAVGRFDLGNGVVVDIPVGVRGAMAVSIHAEYAPQYQMLIPFQQTDEAGVPIDAPGDYRPFLIGYAHRKDGITPGGKVALYDYIAFGGTAMGPEVHYASDGMAMMLYISGPFNGTAWSAQEYVLNVSISGLVDDLASMKTGNGTPLRIPAAGMAIVCRGMVPATNREQHFTGGTVYGVSRSPEVNSMTAVASVNEITGAANTTQIYFNDGTHDFSVTCSWVQAGIYFLTASSDATPTTSAYAFGVDLLIEHQTNVSGTGEEILDYSLESSPPPVSVPVGNHNMLVITRQSATTGDSSALFGKYFDLVAYNIAGASPLAYGADLSGLITNYLITVDISGATLAEGRRGKLISPPEYRGNMATDNLMRMNSFMLGLLHSARQPAPVVGDGVLLFSQVMCDDWFSAPPRRKTERFVCVRATENGLYHRGDVFPAYFGAGTTQSNVSAVTTEPIWYRKFCGAVCVGGSNVILFVYQVRWDYVGMVNGSPAYANTIVGYSRLTSDDAGATWSEYAGCTIQGAEDYDLSILTAPKLVGVPTIGLTDAKLVAGMLRVNAGVVLDTQIVFSDDGGQTWAVNAAAGRGHEFSAFNSDPSSLVTPVAGLGVVIVTGNHIDGYAPSPFAHVPTFYGDATAASRINTGDAGL